LRRSEAVLLFLFIATAIVFFATRPKDQGALPIPANAAAADVDLKPNVAIPSLAAFAAPTAAPKPTATPMPAYFSSAWVQAHPPVDAPPFTAQGAIVIDADSQQIMLAKNIDVRRPPASIMKLVTAMVALDLALPGQKLSVSRDAANMEPNRMGLSLGETLSVQELLYGMLLDSGNDAAQALADGLPGGEAAFIQRMNAKATGLGLQNTHFVDSAGLDDDNYTTPYDMAVLAETALTGYPTIRTVVSTKEESIPGSATHKAFDPTNLNDLLWSYPGTYGAKVGYTDAAEYTIVLAAQKSGHNVLIVLMGSQHHFTEGKALFDWAFGHLPTPDNSPARKFQPNLERASRAAP
jgi:serine-type D-Ala-D-Ala carboxypeptidase (penicillin-binding protein 5/6)